MAVFPHRDDEAIASGILISVHLAVPAVIFVIDCNSEGSPSGKHLRVPGSVRPGDVLGERIYLQPSQNSLPTLIKPQKCLTIIIILTVVRHILLFSARLRLENSRSHRNHSY